MRILDMWDKLLTLQSTGCTTLWCRLQSYWLHPYNKTIIHHNRAWSTKTTWSVRQQVRLMMWMNLGPPLNYKLDHIIPTSTPTSMSPLFIVPHNPKLTLSPLKLKRQTCPQLSQILSYPNLASPLAQPPLSQVPTNIHQALMRIISYPYHQTHTFSNKNPPQKINSST